MHDVVAMRRLAAILLAVIDRNLAHDAREGRRQLSGGRFDTEDDIRKRRSAHRSRVPGVQDCVDLVDNVGERQRPASENHRDHRLPGSSDATHELGLVAGQIDVGPRMRFAGEYRFFAEEQQRRVTFAGGARGNIELVIGAAARVFHRPHYVQVHVDTCKIPDCLQRRHAQALIAIKDPRAELLVRRVGERTDHGK